MGRKVGRHTSITTRFQMLPREILKALTALHSKKPVVEKIPTINIIPKRRPMVL